MFEQVLRRRADGRWVTDRLEHRSQHTNERWDKPDEQAPWRGVWQQTANSTTYYVQRERLLYVGVRRFVRMPSDLLGINSFASFATHSICVSSATRP
jgi:hypothetical protein